MTKITKSDFDALIRKEVELPDVIDIWTLRAADEEDPDARNRFSMDDGANGVGTDDFFAQIGMDPYELSADYASDWIEYDADTDTLTDAQRVEVGIAMITDHIQRREENPPDITDEWVDFCLPLDVEGKTVTIRYSLHFENRGMGVDCTDWKFHGAAGAEDDEAANPDPESDEHTVTLEQLQQGKYPEALRTLILQEWRPSS